MLSGLKFRLGKILPVILIVLNFNQPTKSLTQYFQGFTNWMQNLLSLRFRRN